MTLIFNLAITHRLNPIQASLDEFIQLCNKYNKEGCSNSCPSFFRAWSNTVWVQYQYYINDTKLIQPYRCGKINTEHFLNNLLTIFDFLKNIKPKNSDWKNDSTGYYWSIKSSKDEMSDKELNQQYRFFLLEHAWNAIIDLDDNSNQQFLEIVERAKKEPVYLVSNTNELNVNKIIALLKQKNPEIEFNSVDLSVEKDDKPIELMKNIYLCLSYKYNSFKTEKDNKELSSNSTMSLIYNLINKLTKNESEDINNIKVISHYQKDLDEAIKNGISKENTFSVEEFFKTNAEKLNIQN